MEPPLSHPPPFPAIPLPELKDLILSFPGGSSGGPDALRPIYLKELTAVREPIGSALLASISGLLTLMVKGQVPQP